MLWGGGGGGGAPKDGCQHGPGLAAGSPCTRVAGAGARCAATPSRYQVVSFQHSFCQCRPAWCVQVKTAASAAPAR